MKKLIYTTAMILFAFASNAQINWQKGGNAQTPPLAPPTIGTDATWNSPFRFVTNGAQRMFLQNGNNNNPLGGNNSGYLSVGNPPAAAPLFNISVLTASVGNGDFLIGGTTSKSPNSYMGLIDASSTVGTFVPTYIGSLDNIQTGPAISTLGNINNANDNAPGINNFPVHRFIVGKNFTPFTSGLSNLNEITNRIAFTWQNASNIKMLMNAAGRLRIGNNLNIPANLPNNRIEITSSAGIIPPFNDPYFGTVNGSSGLRFTNLTSVHTPIPNGVNGVNATKVLTVDQNGDVVLTNPMLAVTSNNGIVITPANVIQLGSNCAATSAGQKSLQGLQNNRFLHLNGNNFVFGDGGRVGIGMPPGNGGGPCINVNNKLEVRSTAGNPYFGTANGASGLRFTLLTSTNTPVANGVNGVNSANLLTVDQNGDVVLTNAIAPTTANNGLQVTGTNVQLGGDCSVPAQVTAAQLLTDRKIPLGSKNLIFTSFPTPGKGNVGFGDFNNTQCFPGNLVEIRNNQAFPNATSGLRLSDLAGATPFASNNQVLSINASGDVILTNAPTSGSGFGNLCTNTQNPLLGNFEMPLATNKYLFTGQGTINGTTQQDVVGIGYACGSALPAARLSVLNQQTANVTDENYAAYFVNNNIGSTTNSISGAVYGLYNTINNNAFAINSGGIFEANGSFKSIGVLGRTSKATAVGSSFGGPATRITVGVMGVADTVGTSVFGGTPSNFGVYGYANQGINLNVGVYGECQNFSGAFNAGVYGRAPFGTGGSAYAGYFDGDVSVIGNFTNPSDISLKQNIDSISNALNIIKQLKPYKFDFKTSSYPQLNLPTGKQFGLIAQDVQPVLPEIVNAANHPSLTLGGVTYAAVSYSTVEYVQLIPVIIKAIQLLESKLHLSDSLNSVQAAQITALTSSISSCCSNSSVRLTGISGGSINQQNINLSDADVIVLNQNTPNPFAEQTTISYNVPAKYKFAQMVFKTIEGKIIRTVDITTKGKGQLNVFASDLSAGLYVYSLIVDGEIVDTKKMVKE